MNNYSILLRNTGMLLVKADYFTILDGFVRLFIQGQGEIAAYSADNVEYIVRQKKYTLEEVLAQLSDETEQAGIK